MPNETLSASKIKTLKSCSWLYWCVYKLKLPDKTNAGALKGGIAHLVFECLGKERHKKHYDLILNQKDVSASKAVLRLIKKHVKNKQLDAPEHLADILVMVQRCLSYDFFGYKIGKPTEIVSEKKFEFIVDEDGVSYKVKGFIDKLFIYGDQGIVLIRDFKTNKKKYEGEEVTDNLQDNIYTLAVKKLYPQYKNIRMEFLFLKQETEDEMIMSMAAKSKHELAGFEYELSQYQQYADSFDDKKALSNMAANQGMPKQGFSGRLLCGFASKPGELKKDGNPKWHCAYKFPFDYYILVDKEGKQIKSAFSKVDLLPFLKEGMTVKKMKYGGCPSWTRSAKSGKDDFDLDF